MAADTKKPDFDSDKFAWVGDDIEWSDDNEVPFEIGPE